MLQAVLVLVIFTFIPRVTFPLVLFIVCLHHGGPLFLLTYRKGNLLMAGGNYFL